MTANRTGSLCDSLLGPADQSAPSQLVFGRNLRTIHSEWPAPSAIHLGEGDAFESTAGTPAACRRKSEATFNPAAIPGFDGAMPGPRVAGDCSDRLTAVQAR